MLFGLSKGNPVKGTYVPSIKDNGKCFLLPQLAISTLGVKTKKSKIILRFLAQETGWKMLLYQRTHMSGELKGENEFPF